jgi:hypothetical protein
VTVSQSAGGPERRANGNSEPDQQDGVHPMATKHHTHVPLSALAAILAALLIGSMPVAALVALGSRMEAVK